MHHAFTVDVEEWFQAVPLEATARRAFEPRLDRAMNTLMEILAERDVCGTFFWLGPAAAAFPEIVKKTAAAGHEIGCHGWSHDLIYEMTPDRFRDETRRATQLLEDLTGAPVTSYRAAYFSITRQSLWALDVLAELGFRYDSSIFPVRNWRYGIPDYRREPHQVVTKSGPLNEFPISVRTVLGQNVPVSGGAYFRLYPYAVTRANFRAFETMGRPIVFYLHPWELDPHHPRVGFYWRAWLTHYANLSSTVPKLRRLLSEFRFSTLNEVWNAANSGSR